MLFGIIAMILDGISWTVWGYVAGVVPQRKLNYGLIVAASAVLAVIFSACCIGVLLLLESYGVVLNSAVAPAIPDFSNINVIIIMALVVIAGIFNFSQAYFMGKAMKFGPNGIIWSIVQSGFIVPFAIGIICFREPLTLAFGLSMLLVLSSLVIFAITADNAAKGHWLLMTILAFGATCICQSLQYVPSNIDGVDTVSSVWRTLCYFSGLLLGFLISLIVSKQNRIDTVRLIGNKYTWIYGLLIVGVSGISCYLLFYPGIDAMVEANAGAIANQVMTAAAIVAFEIYSLVFLKEKRKPMQVVALLLCLASLAVLGML